MKAKILLVDDEEDMVAFIRDALEDSGYEVFSALRAEEAKAEIVKNSPDLIVLDVMMPDMDGYAFCREIREDIHVPILFLSARESEVDRIYGLAAGGDDYLVKPFSMGELKARIEAHLRRERRAGQQQDQGNLHRGPFTVDLKGCELRYRGQAVPLTRREFAIVELLALHPGQIFSRDRIYEKVWGYDAAGDDTTVTEHVKNIRAKVAAINADARCIETVWGVGYKWEIGP
ncbi:response regulator transcription factor [Paenibacillus sp. GCM10027628]|uniref:response regulator transcription factor n=1 Tax=Paenibacillus sp. GCM10027628 TaxID=3273413 RepID=UPI003636E258